MNTHRNKGDKRKIDNEPEHSGPIWEGCYSGVARPGMASDILFFKRGPPNFFQSGNWRYFETTSNNKRGGHDDILAK